MGELTDPRPLARVATIVVVVWMVAELLLRVATTAVIQLSRAQIDARSLAPLDTVQTLVAIAAGVALIRLMRVLSAAQARAIAAQAFA